MSRPYARNLANNRQWGKQSKALDKSVNNTPMCLFWSSADFQSSIHLTRNVWQLWPLRKALRSLLKIDTKCLNNWSFIVDSYNFDANRSVISLYQIIRFLCNWDLLPQVSCYQERYCSSYNCLSKKSREELIPYVLGVRFFPVFYHTQ